MWKYILCKNCGENIKIRHQSDERKEFCNSRCKSLFHRKQKVKTMPPKPSHSNVTTGAISELIVSADLLKRGLSVFRALSPSCTCDLIVLQRDQAIKIEVTTGTLTKHGFNYPPKDRSKSDVVAVVMKSDGSIRYLPDFFS